MPQGRRKQPFSGKQKRDQLREKKERRERDRSQSQCSESSSRSSSRARLPNKGQQRFDPQLGGDAGGLGENLVLTSEAIAKINAQPDGTRRDANRYALTFFRENNVELNKRVNETREPFEVLPAEDLEVKSSDVFPDDALGLPRRPPWDFKQSPQELDRNEQRYFRQYLEHIEKEYGSLTTLSHFELNLETWRQLWRVVEMADVVLMVVDIRHPVFHFPPALYNYVTKELGKDFIIVLNKADLIPAPLVVAWLDYFKTNYPGIHVTPFASYAGMKMKENGKHKGRRIGKLRMASEGAKRLYKVCQDIVKDKVDISNWLEKIESELKEEDADFKEDEDVEYNPAADKVIEKVDLSYYKGERYKDGILTIGCVGHPNVGKSSVLNALMGKKVVSVSRTPGHTKYFQTIFITPTVKLCDCPGLVFPSKIPKAMQVLMGCFPIAQLREPYSAIQYMGQRLNMPAILKLQHPENEANDSTAKWSAHDICEAWAIRRGFRTAKAARPDVYRAANHILRMALDGRTLCLAFYPEGYIKNQAHWQSHPDVAKIEVLQCQRKPEEDEDYLNQFDADEEHLPRATKKERSRRGRAQAAAKADSESEEKPVESDKEEASSTPTVTNRFALLDADD